MSRSRVPQKPRSFGQILLREMTVLVPLAVIFAVYQGGSLQDWLLAIGGVALLGLAFAWLLYTRQTIAQRPMPARTTTRPPRRKR